MSEFSIQKIQSAVEGVDPNGAFSRSSEAGVSSSSHDAAPGATFTDVLRQAVDQVNTHQTEADFSIKELVAGRNKNMHETMLAVEKADASLKLMMQVRNKIIDAYKEVMRMQV